MTAPYSSILGNMLIESVLPVQSYLACVCPVSDGTFVCLALIHTILYSMPVYVVVDVPFSLGTCTFYDKQKLCAVCVFNTLYT